jgi:serine/threonine protein kinase
MLVDLGLSKLVPADLGIQTHATIIGTPQYVSPEMVMRMKNYCGAGDTLAFDYYKSDAFSFGLTLLRAATL